MFWRKPQFFEKKQNLCIACMIGIAFVVGFLSNVLLESFNQQKNSPQNGDLYNNNNNNNNNNKLTNPLLACGDIVNLSNALVEEMKSDVSDYISRVKKNAQVDTVALYFRDLNNGPWFGFDEKTEFIPGSLLKVPFAIGLYKMVEGGKISLSQKKEYDKVRSEFVEYFDDKAGIELGKTYSIEELIRSMIIHSDNNSAFLLTDFEDTNAFTEIYRDLGMAEPEDGNYSMPVRTYASFFRILFNATYLNKENSERLLSTLSQTSFIKGLRAGVPSNILVAHKFGERAYNDSDRKQLHDCGIVYFPGKPYLLCVMTRGADFEKMASVIKNISGIIYDDIHNNSLE